VRLRDAGCAPRQMDTLGAVLAGWWVLTRDGVPDYREALDGVAAIADFLQRADEVAAQSSGRRVIEHLRGWRIEKDHTTNKFPAGELAASAWSIQRDPETGEPMYSPDASTSAENLARHGMRIVRADQLRSRNGRPVARGGAGDGLWVAYDAPPIKQIFEKTEWGARFRYYLEELPGVVHATAKVRVGVGGTHAPSGFRVWCS
jgi:hypothetical protein